MLDNGQQSRQSTALVLSMSTAFASCVIQHRRSPDIRSERGKAAYICLQIPLKLGVNENFWIYGCRWTQVYASQYTPVFNATPPSKLRCFCTFSWLNAKFPVVFVRALDPAPEEYWNEGGQFLAESSFHGNAMQRFSMRAAYCKWAGANFLQSDFFNCGSVLRLQRSWWCLK